MSFRRLHTLFVISFAGALPAALTAKNAGATTINVNTFNWNEIKDGKCSLPEAVDAVNTRKQNYDCPAGNGSNDTINLQVGNYVAAQDFGLTISSSVTIVGANPNPYPYAWNTTIDGSAISADDGYLFAVSDPSKIAVTFKNIGMGGPQLVNQDPGVTGIWGVGDGHGSTITVTGCLLTNFTGSAILVDGMNLVVQSSQLELNATAVSGGGIEYTDFYGYGGNLTVTQSTIDQNTAANEGGGIYYAGSGTSSLTNTTIAYNNAPEGGGLGLYPLKGSFALNTSTVAGNYCGTNNCLAGGVDAITQGGTATINASVIANNFDQSGNQVVNPQPDDWNSNNSKWVTESNSIIQNSIWGITVTNGGGNANNLAAGAAIGPYTADPTPDGVLIPQGGPYPLPVIIPTPTSTAIDFLTSLSQTTDERNFARGVQVKGNSKQIFDIGAVEYDPNTQAETMSSLASSAPWTVVTASGYSNGKGAELAATKVGDTVILYNPTVISDVNYTMSARFATGPNEGEVQVEIAPNTTFATGTVTELGSPIELYSAKAGFVTVTFPGTQVLDPDNTNCWRLRVTGKHAGSSNYYVFVDYLDSTLP